MDLVFDFLQTACFIIVLSYVLSRANVLNDNNVNAKISKYKMAAISLIFLFISLYGAVIRSFMVSGVYVDTRIAGIAMSGMIFGYIPAAMVLIPTIAVSVFLGDITIIADIASMMIAFALSGYYHKNFPHLDAVLSGIIAGFLEIIHMLFIVWLVKPMSTAKELVYSISFPMIVINGLAVLLFVLVMKDLNDRKRLWEKDQRTQSEKAFARDIQMSLLSKDFDIDPRIDMNAYIEPALEVGGDLYSYTIEDGKYLKFVIGDVSGKGIPAALMMSRCETIFQDLVQMYGSPAELMEAMNKHLCAGNKELMFVTAFVGFLDPNSGRLIYSNAGHLKPLLVIQGDKPITLDLPKGKPLGIIKKAVYENMEFHIKPNQYLVLTTDGVTEAENINKELYGLERTEESLTGLGEIDAETINKHILDGIKHFCNGANQSDDITLMCIGIKDIPFEYTIKNDISELISVCSQINENLVNIEKEIRDDIVLVIEEYVSNTIKNGYEDNQSGKIRIAIWPEGPNSIIQIQDDGKAFNQLAAESPMMSVAPEERKLGGMGIRMIKNRVTNYKYHTSGSGNLVSMYIRNKE